MHVLRELIFSRTPEFSHLTLFRSLIQSIINSPQENSEILFSIIQNKKDLFLKEFINLSDLNLEMLNEQNMTPIQYAIANGSVESIKILAQAGSNLHVLWSTEDESLTLLDMLNHDICAQRSFLEKTVIKDSLIPSMKNQRAIFMQNQPISSITFSYQMEQMDKLSNQKSEYYTSPMGSTRMFKI